MARVRIFAGPRAQPRKRNPVYFLAALALSSGVAAQQPPTGGALTVPLAPPVPRAAPEIRIEQRAAPAAASAATAPERRIRVQTLRVSGAQLFSEADLIAVTGFTAGSELALSDLQAMAARITSYYRDRGYFVAQAYLPAQDIRDESVTIAVSEGRLGRVELRNDTRLSDHVARSTLQGVDHGGVITAQPLESGLLLLSDVPGINVSSTLSPGAVPGTSDLAVHLTPAAAVSGSIDADNAGNYYTGAYRLGATVNLNNPFGLGDIFSLRVLGSSGLKYARASYELQAGRGRVGAAYTHLEYEVGKEFAALGAHGTAQIASIWGRYPMLRSRKDNVWFQLGLDAKKFDDRVDAIPAATERNAQVLSASVFGDHRDDVFGGGVSTYFLTWSHGRIDIETPAARALDTVTAGTQGDFDKLSFHAMRLQRLGGPFSLHAAISGQVASKNLDVSEKMSLGGMNAVRAFPEGEAYADEGYLLTLEARMDLPPLPAPVPGSAQLVAFVDTGTVRMNKEPWAAGDNSRTLSGAGVGINWGEAGNFLVRASYARKLGGETATSSPDKSGRFWIQLVKYL